MNRLNLGFEMLYHDIGEGGIALLSKEEMELCQTQVTAIQLASTVSDGTSDTKKQLTETE